MFMTHPKKRKEEMKERKKKKEKKLFYPYVFDRGMYTVLGKYFREVCRLL